MLTAVNKNISESILRLQFTKCKYVHVKIDLKLKKWPTF